MDNFANFFEFQKRFSDNASCRAYLEHLRWEGTITCPFCQGTKYYAFKGGHTYKCAEPKCRKKFTVTVGTIFENTKVPLAKWFWAIYVATSHKKGISSAQLARDIDVEQRTAWFMLHRLREALRDRGTIFSNKTVELDETFIGGKEKNKHANKKTKNEFGHSTTTKGKEPVLGIVERGGLVYAEAWSRKKEFVIPKIRQRIVPGTLVITDEHAGYKDLRYYYKHKTINHSERIYVDGDIHTNTIEGFFSQVKRSIIGIYHFVTPRHLNRYCGEWTFRYNTRRMNDTERFNVSVQRMVGKRLTYKWLTAKHNWD